MKKIYIRTLIVYFLFLLEFSLSSYAQTNGVTTYMNPIMGDHPDQTLMRVGNDFYCAGSSFHYNPYIPILHSTDLVHWEIIYRLVPSNWASLQSDAPGDGTWQGALAQFGGYFWLYFSNYTGGGQYFCKATSMAGPWSAPTKVSGSGVTGYDNSVFVDDDGTPYLVMKNGANVNRILKLDKTTGNSTGTVLNMDWLNPTTNPYKMAEGPVMCKQNGRYYYFFAGDVYGGQWVISSATLTGTQSAWTTPAVFFTGTATLSGFTAPNHISQPIKLDDGTWWCMSHGYGLDGWRGQGRIATLHQVTWDASNVPHSAHASSSPVTAPNLPNTNNIAFNFPREDYFSSTTLKYNWFFWNKANATKFSLSANPGYMRLNPGTGTTHILQQEAGRVYSMITKVTVNATSNGQSAGLRIQNGGDALYVRMYAGYNGSAKIGFSYNTTTTEISNTIGNTVWLKINRDGHNVTGFYSADGKTWTQVGGTVSTTDLDDYSGTTYNDWVGNAVGLYATSVSADFDLYKYRDGLSALKVAGRNNWNSVTTSTKTPGSVVSSSSDGGWAMLAGVSMGDGTIGSTSIEVNAASASGTGSLEIWNDNIGGAGTKLATIPISASGGADVWKNYTASITATGQHYVYLKFVGTAGSFSVNTIRFITGVSDLPIVAFTAPTSTQTFAVGTPITFTVTATPAGTATITKVDFYNGTTLLKSVTASPYTISWTPTVSGSNIITATATDSKAKTGSTSFNVVVPIPQTPYGGTPKPIPGTIQFEEYDEGGNNNAYFDTSPGSDVTPVVNYRTTEDVDIETCTDAGAGYNIGFGMAGEWLEYTVNVAATGKYNLTLRVACNGDGRTVSLQSNGVDIAANVAISNTTDWQTWTDITVNNIQLTAGVQILRLTIGATDYINLNYMTFTSVAPLVPTVTSPISYCQGATATALTAIGTSLKWYTVATGGTASTTAPIPSTSTVGSTIYYVSQTINSIESNRAAIIVSVSATPAAPTVISPVNYNQNATATTLTATGTALKWFTVATAGTALASTPTPVTTAAGTVNYYVSQTVNTCESPRAIISVITTIIPPKDVVLQAGWNVIGCPIIGSTDIATALSSIWTNVETVKNLDVFYSSVNPTVFNSLTKLNWGQGYLVKVKSACTLTWK